MHPFGKEKKTRQLLQSETSLMNAEQFAVSKSVQKGGMEKICKFPRPCCDECTSTVKTSL